MKWNLPVPGIKSALLLLLLLLCGITYILNPDFFALLWQILRHGDIQETVLYIKSFGSWAVLFSFILVVLVNMIGFPPTIILSVANTFIFGMVPGILLSWLAETVGVILSFLLLRFFFSEQAQKIIAKHATLQKMNSFSEHNGFQGMLIARMIPYFPSGLLNALGAVSQISLIDYSVSSLIGKLPSTALEAFIGHDAMMAGEHLHRLIFVILLTLVVIGVIHYYRRNKKRPPEKT